jgi:flavin reductase (DIM6/NTAB) family NADH-FMN oxidoreductase RutF
MTLDASTYRRMIGHFVTGVTVVSSSAEGRLHGMTANSVTSVSLEPLLLLVCVDKRATAHREIEAAGRFAVNILNASQEGLARVFSAPAAASDADLRGVPYRLGPHGSPLIDGCLAWLECELDRSVEAGDHTIFIGRVLGGEIGDDAPPLLYYKGSYWDPAG